LRLSDFDSKLAGKLNYYIIGYLFGLGRQKRAAQTDIWRELQVLANFGLCDCQRLTQNFDLAVAYCQRALALDNDDQVSHYALGVTYAQKFNASNNPGFLDAATQHFQTTIRLNKDTEEADKARRYLEEIGRVKKVAQQTDKREHR
jgi:tetratricopeptide (TPR) repeat protein